MENKCIYTNIIDSQVFSYLFPEEDDLIAIEGNSKEKNEENLLRCLCILGFDDNVGQFAESVYPPGVIDIGTMKYLSGLGFPETNSFTSDGELTYMFKIRKNNQTPLKCLAIGDQKFFFCYTHFIQKKNDKFKRGYMQKSIVIVSDYYFPDLFVTFLSEFRDMYMKEEINIAQNEIFSSEKLEEIYSIFNRTKLRSSTYGLEFDINLKKDGVLNGNGNSYENSFNFNLSYSMSLFPMCNRLFEHLTMYYVGKILSLWELVLTETPLIVSADDPSKCSEVVMLISSIIFPLNYQGDIRPYFTIYDSDFKDYREDTELKSLNSPLIGVINPICVRTFKDWVVIHFDDQYFNDQGIDNPTKSLNFTSTDLENFMNDSFYFEINDSKSSLTPNKALIKTFYDLIVEDGDKSMNKLNMYLRMYLIELNNDFMRTFEDYFFIYDIDHIRRLAFFKQKFSIFEIFNKENFFKYLNTVGDYFNLKYVQDKRKTCELYKSFLDTKCFQNYLKILLQRIKKLKN